MFEGMILLRTISLFAFFALSACAPYVGGEAWEHALTEHRLAGTLKADREPEDAPFNAEDLTEAFRRTVFRNDEEPLWEPFPSDDPADEADDTEAEYVLHRYPEDIRYTVFSTGGERGLQLSKVAQMAKRLTRITGRKVSETFTTTEAEMLILFMRPQDYGPVLDEFSKETHPRLRHSIEGFGKSLITPCVLLPFFPDTDDESKQNDIYKTIILIRAGLPEAYTQACVEEEMAQTMGLYNDHPDNRPSIFNDDQEFALLTRHDELLMKILYDPRLKTGMGEAEAMPIVAEIARELLPES